MQMQTIMIRLRRETARFLARSLIIIITALSIAIGIRSPARASHNDSLLIAQIQTAGAQGANDEWIELYNPTASSIDLSTFSIQYKSATGSTFQKKNFLSSASISPHGSYLVAHSSSSAAANADMTHSSFALAANGGNLFLVSSTALLSLTTNQSIVDRVGYGNGDSAEGSSAPAPASGQSIERAPSGENGNGTDTNNNAADFSINTNPTPRFSTAAARPALTAQNMPSTETPLAPSATPSSSSDALTSTPETQASPDTSAAPSTFSTQQETSDASRDASFSILSTPPQSSADATGQQSSAAATFTVTINELLTDPSSGDKEWIELYSTIAPLTLTGWSLTDSKGTIASLDLSFQNNFSVIELASNKLNNDGDLVVLNNAAGQTIDRVSYGTYDDGNRNDNAPSPPKGITIGRFPDGRDTASDVIDWYLTKQPTRGAANIIATVALLQREAPDSRLDSGESSSRRVLINEFVADPTDGEEEWIELYNASEAMVSLAGWSIEEGSGASTPLSGTLGLMGPQRFTTIERPKGILNNGGDMIVLKDNRGLTVDLVVYGQYNDGNPQGHAPTAPNPFSVARTTDGAFTGNNRQDFAVTETPTKGTSNRIILPTPQDKPTNVRPMPAATNTASVDLMITELFPNPSGADRGAEWIEMYNGTNEAVSMADWLIAVNNDQECALPETLAPLPPKTYRRIGAPELCIPLPNATTTVELTRASDGRRIDRVRYPAAQENASWARDDKGRWRWSTVTTPGASNRIVKLNLPPEVRIDGPSETYVGVVILLDASDTTDPDNDTLTYQWILDGGVVSASVAPSAVFHAPGTRTISLTVSDGAHRVKQSKRIVVRTSTELAADAETELSTHLAELMQRQTSDASTRSRPSTTNPKLSTASPVRDLAPEDLSTVTRGTPVRISGPVSVAPGMLGERLLYIAGSGVGVKLPTGKLPKLSLGSLVRVTGTVTDSAGDRFVRVKTMKDIHVVGASPPPAAHPTTIRELSEMDDNPLVKARGIVREARPKRWLLEDDESEIPVVLPQRFPETIEGSTVEVTGVLQRPASGMRLASRTREDIVVLTPAAPSERTLEASRSTTPALTMLIAITLGGLLLTIIVPRQRADAASTTVDELSARLNEQGELLFPRLGQAADSLQNQKS